MGLLKRLSKITWGMDSHSYTHEKQHFWMNLVSGGCIFTGVVKMYPPERWGLYFLRGGGCIFTGVVIIGPPDIWGLYFLRGGSYIFLG